MFNDEQFQHVLSKYSEGNVPLPDKTKPNGITPTFFEFFISWKNSRLHDRIAYRWIGHKLRYKTIITITCQK